MSVVPSPNLPAEIVFSSGGARGALVLGAAWHLQRCGMFERARVFGGTSVGAVIAAGIVLGRNPRAMLGAAIRFPMRPDMTFENFGMDSGRGLETFICRVLRIDTGVTLRDIFDRTRTILRICVCNVTKRAPEYWTHETHPDVPLVRALRISCSIPFVFSAVAHDGQLFVDGAVVDPLPTLSPARSLAIGFREHHEEPVDTVEAFVEALRVCAKKVPSARHTLLLESRGVIEPLDFTPSARTMRLAFESGKRQASKWTKKIK